MNDYLKVVSIIGVGCCKLISEGEIHHALASGARDKSNEETNEPVSHWFELLN